MPHNLPTKEQMLYAELCIVESLCDHLRDNLFGTAFDDLDMISDMDKVRLGLRLTCSRMKTVLNPPNSKDYKSACY